MWTAGREGAARNEANVAATWAQGLCMSAIVVACRRHVVVRTGEGLQAAATRHCPITSKVPTLLGSSCSSAMAPTTQIQIRMPRTAMTIAAGLSCY